MKKIEKGSDLEDMYQNADQADKPEFAKMRSNILLISGDHYNKHGNRSWERVRTFQDFEKTMKLRLTMNHFGKIARQYSNLLITACPNAKPVPKHEREMKDRKLAELYAEIWKDVQEINYFEREKLGLADDFMHIGEVYTKLYWDPQAGQQIGFEQAKGPDGAPIFEQLIQVDPMTGEQVQTQGEPIMDQSKPLFEGQIKQERVYGFNVLIDPNSDGFHDSPWVCVRKTAPVDELQSTFPDKKDVIRSSTEKPFLVFDMDQGYRQSAKDKEALVKEWYLRPCAAMPNGYYYITIDSHILDEGELPKTPDGKVVFPIIGEYADKIQTKRRGNSPMNPLRAPQGEINRCNSAMAQTQLTLGDDKLVVSNGSKVSSGAKLPGIRAITVTGGMAPTILPGRSGEQYMGYLQAKVSEMYQLAELDESEAYEGQLDPHMLLYRSGSQKRKFNRYIKRFEMFLVKLCETAIDLAKIYYSDERFVRAVGKLEAVNIAEFREKTATHVQVVVEPAADDIESQLGKQLVANHVLQYVGNQLDPSSIGKIVRNMPFSNLKDSFADLTMDDERATNDLLALDRGDLPSVGENDPHEYLIKRATVRMGQPDYVFLPDEIKENYEVYLQAHGDVMKQQKEALQRAQSGFIPDGGAMVKVDYFVKDPNDPTKQAKRSEMPVSALEWLYQKLQEQGTFTQQMEGMPAQVINQMTAGVAPEGAPPASMPQDLAPPMSM